MNYLHFIWIRAKQSARLLRGAGWLWLIAGPLLFLFYLSVMDKLRGMPAAGIAIIALIVPALLHFQRRDAAFVKKHAYRKTVLFGLEYLLLSSLITLPFLFLFGSAEPLLYSLGGVFLLPLLPTPAHLPKTSVPLRFNFIPLTAFEWRAAARQYKWWLIGIYGIGLGGSYWVAPPLLALIFLTALLPSVYEYSEPKEWLEALMTSPKAIWVKVGRHSLIWMLLLAPLLLAFLIFSFRYWYLMAIGLLVSFLYLLFALFYKYAHYIPGDRKTQSGLISGLVGIGLVLPVTAPVCWIYILILYRRAQQRITYFTRF